jgi:DNA-binding ferritin-like protein
VDKIILNLLKLVTQLRIFHWQTESYAQHKAFGNAYESLSDLLDRLVEVHQGKYGRIVYTSPAGLEISNSEDLNARDILTEVAEYLVTNFNEIHDSVKDSDCLNIRDEMVAEINKLKYLLTLK